MNTAEEWIKKLENNVEEIFWKEAERQKFFVEVQLICNVVLIADVQQNESDMCVCVCVCVYLFRFFPLQRVTKQWIQFRLLY